MNNLLTQLVSLCEEYQLRRASMSELLTSGVNSGQFEEASRFFDLSFTNIDQKSIRPSLFYCQMTFGRLFDMKQFHFGMVVSYIKIIDTLIGSKRPSTLYRSRTSSEL